MIKKLIGIIIIAFGIFLELTWLSICFGTVIVGVLLLIFAPSILFFPFNFFLTIGLTLIYGNKYNKKSSFRYQQYSQHYSQQSSQQNNYYQEPESNLAKYYKTLESSDTDSFETIKKRYRMLMKEYHYDSIVSKNLPEDMIKFAEQKTKSLNEAYSAIKQAKGK